MDVDSGDDVVGISDDNGVVDGDVDENNVSA
jgi:hypothetical protein